jgi:serine/threonine protein kinase
LIQSTDTLDQHALHPKQPLKFDQKIGQGAYGSVYTVELDGKPCIAKRLLDILMGRSLEEPVEVDAKDVFHQRFLQECALLSQMKHTNIVKFIAIHYGSEKYDLTLLMERLSTDLHKYLLKNPNIALIHKVSILRDVSSDLLYMHELSVIHRDLSAANVLLTSSLQAKIADLGVSRIINRTSCELTNIPGTLAYMPPEAMKDKAVYDDIFSCGVVALFTAIQEFPEFSYDRVPDSIARKGEGEIYKRRVWIRKMGTKESDLHSPVLCCLQDNPQRRPSSVRLNIILEELYKDCQSLCLNNYHSCVLLYSGWLGLNHCMDYWTIL